MDENWLGVEFRTYMVLFRLILYFEKYKKNGSATCFCWFIWEKGFKGETTLRWFN